MKYPAMLTLAVLFALAGCAKDAASSKVLNPFSPSPNQPHIDPRILQEDLMSYADRYGSAVSDAYDQLALHATTQDAKDMALGRKAGHLTAATVNAVDDSPVVGLLDMLVMATLTRSSAEDSWFTEMYGDDAKNLVLVLKRYEDEIWQIATQYLSSQQLVELHESIDRWRREHPDQRYLAMVRLSEFSRAKTALNSGNRDPGSVFGLLFLDPFASLDPAIREVERSRETAERMFYYFQRMPMLLAWQAELASRRSLAAPQIQKFLGDTDKFTTSTLRFADATRAVADSISQFPKFATEERQRAVEQVDQKIAEQRDAAVKQLAAAVATERDTAVRQIASAVTTEREAAIAQATTRASSESNVVLERFGSLVQAERADLIREVDATASKLIDRILWGQVIVVLISVTIAVVGALTYRWLRPHRQ